MTATAEQTDAVARRGVASAPRFGGVLWRIARSTSPLTLPLAGKRWNPIFAVVEHRGRKTGRPYATPVAARRVADGFVISLAFGAQVDWFRNLLAAGRGTIRWRGRAYRVTTPEPIDAAMGLAAFHPVQRALLRIGGVGGYVWVTDVDAPDR
ncbi:MAG: nitroreductase family deazaflavin-dependent oxidoreductase [Chloroflexi bacterium]|nr:nitroreductase family deazaflavin-dependent oxidoreductase [Chloroflexota bacterium]